MKKHITLIAAGILLIANSCNSVQKTNNNNSQQTTMSENTVLGKNGNLLSFTENR